MSRRGMTLVEMMVAVTATLILMGAVAQVFSVFGGAVSNSRAMLEMDSRLRVVANRLRTDLKGVTARTLPPLSPDSAEGYFEVLEGPWKENDVADGANVARTDVDDVLLFTTRSPSDPFVGRAPSGIFESPVAEVAWFARETVDPSGRLPVTYTLYRKQLLVLGYVGVAPFNDGQNGSAGMSMPAHYLTCDVSVRDEGGRLRPNTLADLTKPENRFMHAPNFRVTLLGTSSFPYLFVPHMWPSASTTVDVMNPTQYGGILPGLIFDGTSARAGEDVVLTNVLSFDVRVFDPGAPVSVSGNTAVVPGDPGFDPSFVASPVASGAYVDLDNGITGNALLATTGTTAYFGGPIGGSFVVTGAATRSIYDTWSTHYESDGIDQDNPADVVDGGSNGIDDDLDGEVDEVDEQDGRAPYPRPLRGIEVRIRCYEPTSRQVRQVTVRHTFVPH